MSSLKRLNHIFPLIAASCFTLMGCVSQQTISNANGGTGAAKPPAAPRTVIVVPQGPRIINKSVAAGSTTTIERLFNMNVDCSARSLMTIKISQDPVHGTAVVSQRDDYPSYPPNNPRSACNKNKTTGTFVDYTPAAGFTGSDFMTLQVFTDTGQEVDEKIAITVK